MGSHVKNVSIMRAHNTPSSLYTLITLDCVSALHMFCCCKHLASLLVIDKLSRVTDTIISRYPQQSDSWVCDAARFITPLPICVPLPTVSTIYRVTARLTALMLGTHVTCHDSSLLARHNTRLSFICYIISPLRSQQSPVCLKCLHHQRVSRLCHRCDLHTYTPPINPCSAARGWVSPIFRPGSNSI